MTTAKIPMAGKRWRENHHRALTAFRENRHFLFSAYPDADALGTMLALMLYLNLLGKKATLFLPSPVKSHLQFIKEIIQYNDIKVIKDRSELESLEGKMDTVVFCDTAHRHLVPYFSIFQKCFLSRGVCSIEIDHHFGNDSAAISDEGIHLFRQANASTEIAAELLRDLHTLYPDGPDPFDQRNIAISLLLGLLTDTSGGRAVPLPEDYAYWNRFLGKSLGVSPKVEDRQNGKESRFRSPQEIMDYINRLNPEQERWVNELKQWIVRHEGVGELDLLDSSLARMPIVPEKYGNGGFFQIWNTMANVVPQVGGKVGLFYFNGTNAEGKNCIFLKMRRAFSFDRYDLRESETAMKMFFGDYYMGGGGHPGAVSFRIQPMADQDFKSRISGLVDYLQKHIQ